MTLEIVIIWLLVGLVAGWLASQLVRGHGSGTVTDIVVGIVGAFIGGMIFRAEGWQAPFRGYAGLIFVAQQSDPRTGFIPINDKLAKFDLMNQFTTHVGSAIFAVPPGAREGSFIGAGLFET